MYAIEWDTLIALLPYGVLTVCVSLLFACLFGLLLLGCVLWMFSHCTRLWPQIVNGERRRD